MRKEALISIIVPVYNVEEYLVKCIESILNQTYKRIQVILVDDGSTDNSSNLCDSYALTDKRIIVIHKENGGLVSARKAGLKVATGDYIGFVDGDDYIEPDMFEQLYNVLIESDVDFVHSGYKKNELDYIYSVSNACIYCMSEMNRIDFYKNMIFDSTNPQYIFPSIWSKLFRKELILKAYMEVPDCQSYGEDLLALCNCIYNCNKVAVMAEGYYHYRIRENSLSHRKDVKALINEYRLYEALCNLFERLNILQECEAVLQKFLANNAIGSIACITGKNVEQYRYPNIQKLLDKRIIIFGAGKVGRDYYSQISRYNRCRIVAWVDNNYKNFSYDFCEIQEVDTILKVDYDYILIAVMMENMAKTIKKELENKGVEHDKIEWTAPLTIVN